MNMLLDQAPGFEQGIELPASLRSEALSVTLLPEQKRYSLRIKSKDLAAVKKASGLKLARKITGTHQSPGLITACLGPDEWMVIAEPGKNKTLEKKLFGLSKKFTLSVTDISHRNIGFTLSGPDAARMINQGCPLDLSLAAFPVGKGTRTGFENAEILLIRTAQEAFHLECWRSFGLYLRDFMVKFVW